ncbi:MAG TPA: pentapeptide repeat-containing protein [Solirubrobacterales bacterium]|nr:pentapeptide repeat-containing protein [Solirubrobacterales bacterium]
MISLIFAVVCLTGIALLIGLGYRRHWQWTGLPANKEASDIGRPAKTLWDWLQLLVVPMVLAIAAFALNSSQAERDRERQDRQAAQERKVAIEEARERALGAYLDRMSDLIVRGDLPDVGIRYAGMEEPSDAQTLARTLTLVVLRRLDGDQKAVVVQFLWETGLIKDHRRWKKLNEWPLWPEWNNEYPSRLPVVSLENADLRGVDLSGSRLAAFGAPRGSGTLTDSQGRVLYQLREGIDLTGADLRGADFSEANLSNASFQDADLRGAVFDGAILTAAVFDRACISRASFQDAVLGKQYGAPPASMKFTGGRDVDFRGADLDQVGMQISRLEDVHLKGALRQNALLPRPVERPGLHRASWEQPNRCESPREWER